MDTAGLEGRERSRDKVKVPSEPTTPSDARLLSKAARGQTDLPATEEPVPVPGKDVPDPGEPPPGINEPGEDLPGIDEPPGELPDQNPPGVDLPGRGDDGGDLPLPQPTQKQLGTW